MDIFVLLVFLEVWYTVLGLTYHCQQGATVTVSLQTLSDAIIVTRYNNTRTYSNNMSCGWTVTSKEGKRLRVKVTESQLNWVPETSICNDYDYVQIFNGGDKSTPLVTWCGEQNPREVVTTGNHMHITFHSDDRNIYQYRGVTMNIEAYDANTECPPEWTRSPDGVLCYSIRSHPETFQDAQKYCRYAQANLVTPNTETQLSFVGGLVNNESTAGSKFWTGLNDIAHNGKYQWLDGCVMGFTNRIWKDGNSGNIYHDCVSYDSQAGVWQEEECRVDEMVRSQAKLPFVCQMSRGSDTPSCQIPDKESKPGTEDADQGAQILTIAVSVTVVVVVLLIVTVILVVYLLYRRRAGNHSKKKAGARPTPSQHDAPPTYQEATNL